MNEWSAPKSEEYILKDKSRTQILIENKTQINNKKYMCNYSKNQKKGTFKKTFLVTFLVIAFIIYTIQLEESVAIIYSLINICKNLVLLAKKLLDLSRTILVVVSFTIGTFSIKALFSKLFTIASDALIWEHILKEPIYFLLKLLGKTQKKHRD